MRGCDVPAGPPGCHTTPLPRVPSLETPEQSPAPSSLQPPFRGALPSASPSPARTPPAPQPPLTAQFPAPSQLVSGRNSVNAVLKPRDAVENVKRC